MDKMLVFLKSVFGWFYCLPISEAIIWIAFATALYLWAKVQFQNMKFWKILMSVLLACWIVVILFGTLGQRMTYRESQEPILMPFYSYYVAFNGGERELLRENFMNVVLFYPAGLLGCGLCPKSWKKTTEIFTIVLIFALMSIGIEICQYRFAMGLAEVDDVIHNTLGALLGMLACKISFYSKEKQREEGA